MSASLSLYLDLIRFAAACAVLTSHLTILPFAEGLIWWRLAPFGEVAVTVFFVLSGYVIAHVTQSRESSLQTYAVARIARL